MPSLPARRIDAPGDRLAGLAGLAGLLADDEPADDDAVVSPDSLRRCLADDRLAAAFAAGFSPGRPERIDALHFAGGSRRLLPTAPGRETMCPVETGRNPDEPPSPELQPLETRLGALLREMMRTCRVSPAAAVPGLQDDAQRHDGTPFDADGQAAVPVRRPVLVDYRHPPLGRRRAVIDTARLQRLPRRFAMKAGSVRGSLQAGPPAPAPTSLPAALAERVPA